MAATNAASATATTSGVEVQCEILRVNAQKCCVKFSYLNPITKVDLYDSSSVQLFLNVRNSEELRIYCDTTFDAE